jgi:chemotaxis signal transduction protein
MFHCTIIVGWFEIDIFYVKEIISPHNIIFPHNWNKYIFMVHVCVGNKRPVTDLAAVWVPDNEAQTCMHCLKVKFTPIQRRVCPLRVN